MGMGPNARPHMRKLPVLAPSCRGAALSPDTVRFRQIWDPCLAICHALPPDHRPDLVSKGQLETKKAPRGYWTCSEVCPGRSIMYVLLCTHADTPCVPPAFAARMHSLTPTHLYTHPHPRSARSTTRTACISASFARRSDLDHSRIHRHRQQAMNFSGLQAEPPGLSP